jgi:hypothetical protein
MIDGGLLQNAEQMKVDAMHSIVEAWRLMTPSTNKNRFMKYSFPIDYVSSNDDSAVKMERVTGTL